eukprot:CAMPEP_0172311068 /NCGR_PEP_ID=MMETSP1058-20130122/13664_1 /TAXON_ID=83371 /ORGANISM="Detonula confervacea, Strain CCMP 353" /LENGTH=184 /DNA_ID=CAMNT_0013024125 /DNA_START=54 /DNA_END=608 /DNA_ORIENTATION=-
MKTAILSLFLAPSVVSFAPVGPKRLGIATTFPGMRGALDDRHNHEDGIINASVPSPSSVQHRRDVLKTGSLLAAFILGYGSLPSHAEEKSYSSNARNMARLNNGDSSGGSLYDNNPTLPKARARRAMVGCKNSSARSLAGESIGKKKFSEKECNQLVMSGEPDFMLGALTELDCPSCPYGIGSR